MPEKSINVVVAENLRYRMERANLTQAALGVKAKVSQKTISNYLNPDQRTDGSLGKQGSPKLWELDLVAKALDCEVWELTREMNDRERAMYDAIEKAYRDLQATVEAQRTVAESQTPTSEDRRLFDQTRLIPVTRPRTKKQG